MSLRPSFCRNCGVKLSLSTKFCESCGNPVAAGGELPVDVGKQPAPTLPAFAPAPALAVPVPVVPAAAVPAPAYQVPAPMAYAEPIAFTGVPVMAPAPPMSRVSGGAAGLPMTVKLIHADDPLEARKRAEAESVVSRLVYDIQSRAELIYGGMRTDGPGTLRMKPEKLGREIRGLRYNGNHTLSLLTEVEVSVGKLITYLNLASKHMLSDTYFQTRLATCLDMLHSALEVMRDCKLEVVKCCWCCKKQLEYPFFRNLDVERVSNRIAAKIQDCRSNFKLKTGMEGEARVAGPTGTNVEVAAPSTVTMTDGGDMTIVKAAV